MRLHSLRAMACGFVAALLTVCAACSVDGHHGNGDDNYYSAFGTMSDAAWAYARPLNFTVDTLRDAGPVEGKLLLTVRHTAGYEYANLWLELTTDLDHSAPDTINLRLADDYGRWLGKGSGPSVQIVDTLARPVSLRRGQRLRLRHIMRTDSLQGIELAGITFIPASQE
ncbi:MAG: gliding motility lipoprotein GldH [Muribaculaceae bacterium]|nr:gliding motility lipoprotein GldH [Muribaculaceae bacterium]